MKKNFLTWPIGKLKRKWQRPELFNLKKKGYKFSDPREVVTIFEKKISKYAGSKYAIAVDNCTDGVFLCLKYFLYMGKLKYGETITIPKRCYLSIPMTLKTLGFKIEFEDLDWSGVFCLKPTNIYDAAVRFTKGMYKKNSYHNISFQIKKSLPIGKGGMILVDSKKAEKWFRQASFEGRDLNKNQWNDKFSIIGWNMYMTPEDAARGILIFDELPKKNKDSANQDNYPDLSGQKIFK